MSRIGSDRTKKRGTPLDVREATGEAKCEECNKTFQRPAHLIRHNDRVHGDREARKVCCPVCAKEFANRDNLNTHIKRIHEARRGDETYSCSYCPKKFWSSKDRDRHTSAHTSEKPYTCSQCNTNFSIKENMMRHVRTVHGTERPHACGEANCGKRFKSLGELRAHLTVHDAHRPQYPCTSCDKVYSIKRSLVLHQRYKHEGQEKRFTCTYCGLQFETSSQLLSHTRKHIGEKPYVCSACPLNFYTSGRLWQHAVRHSGGKAHNCQADANLRSHLESVHRGHARDVGKP